MYGLWKAIQEINLGDFMKKIGLICAALLAGVSLTACSNSASQKSNKKSSSSSITTTKAVKHHKR